MDDYDFEAALHRLYLATDTSNPETLSEFLELGCEDVMAALLRREILEEWMPTVLIKKKLCTIWVFTGGEQCPCECRPVITALDHLPDCLMVRLLASRLIEEKENRN